MSNFRILALDPAKQTGWAHSNGQSGSVSIERPGHYGKRLVALREWLNKIHHRFAFDYLAFEDASYGTPHANMKVNHARVQAVLFMFAADNNLITLDVRPTEIKLMTGRGNATKAEMIQSAKLQLGKDVSDDNEADALFCLEWAKQQIDPATGNVKPREPKKKPRRSSRTKAPNAGQSSQLFK